MKRTRHTAEQIVNKLREADAMLAPDRSICQVVQHLRERADRRGAAAEGTGGGERVADQAIGISILKEANDYLGKLPRRSGGGAS